MNILLYVCCTVLFCTAPVFHAFAQERGGRDVFVENKGQIRDSEGRLRPDIAFVAQAPGMQMFFSGTGIHYALFSSRPASDNTQSLSAASRHPRAQQEQSVDVIRVDMEVVGARRDVSILPEHQAPEYCNFYYAHCPEGIENVRTYERLVYRDIYNSIDLVVYRQSSGLKYDFVVRPGGNVSDIRLRYKGAQSVSLMPDDGLKIATQLGMISEQKPVLYQHNAAARQAVEGRFVIERGEVRFDVPHYDRERELVIDPEVMWSTYLGGSQADLATMIANAGSNGDLVVTGETTSADFPATPGVVQPVSAGRRDMMIAMFGYGGERLWATYYGGSSDEGGRSISGIAVADNGDIVAVGATASQDFPVTPDAFQGASGGQFDIAIIKLDGTGRRLWATYYGGSDNDYGYDVDIDSRGGIIISGETSSADFPVSADAFQPQYGGASSDALVLKLDGEGQRLWATYCGGGDRYWELGFDVAVDRDDNIVLAGSTGSSDFPVSTGAFQTEYAGGDFDMFITKFTSTGSLLWSTLYGGRFTDEGNGVAIDSDNNIVITGISRSADFPVSTNAWQRTLRNQQSDFEEYYDVVILKFKPNGKRLWATYYGGAVGDVSNKVAVDSRNGIWIVGFTESLDFPLTDNALQTAFRGGFECFILNMTAGGEMVWATYYGGAGSDNAMAITIGEDDNVAIAGYTRSTNFPVENAFQSLYGGGENDAFIMRFGICAPFRPAIVAGGSTVLCEGDSVVLQVDAGYALYRWSTGETTPAITVRESGIYTVTVQNDAGCLGLANPISIVVRPQPRPVIAFSGSSVLCEGQQLTLLAPSGFASYLWSDGSTSNSRVVGSAGTYRVTVVDAMGCSGISAPVEVRVVPRPQPDISIVGGPVACDGDSVVLVAPPGFSSYRWSNGATTRSITVHTAGRYSVTVNVGECAGTSATVDIFFSDGLVVEVAAVLTDDTFVLESPPYHQLGCGTVELRNPSDQPLVIGSAFCVINTEFSVPPGQFPLSIAPHSTAMLTVCYMPRDTEIHRDTLVIAQGCTSLRLPLLSRGKRAEMNAEVTGKCNVGLVLKSLPTADGILVIGRPYPHPASEEVLVPVELVGGRRFVHAAVRSCQLATLLGTGIAEGVYEERPSLNSGNTTGVWRFDTSRIPAGAYSILLHTDEGVHACPVVIAR